MTLPECAVQIDFAALSVTFESGEIKSYSVIGFRQGAKSCVVLAATEEHFRAVSELQDSYFGKALGNELNVVYGIPDGDGARGAVLRFDDTLRRNFE